jgi:hypothetical protein
MTSTVETVGADTLNVTVRYAAAPQPFHDPAANRTETLAVLKLRVLAVFGLTEGAQPDGNQVQYQLFHQRQELVDLSRTLGDVAGPAHALELKLAQVVTQGAMGEARR